jgi:hypothetical protein
MSNTKRRFFPFLFLFFYLSLIAVQAQESSPYSRFGIGLTGDNNFAPSASMGGLGGAYRAPDGYNFNNPASLSAIVLTTFEAGVEGFSINRKSQGQTSKIGGADFKYVAVSFPVTKFWGTGVGLIPFSGKDYFISDTVRSNGQKGLAEYEGTGGLYNFYWGNGFKWKAFSLGVNIAYLFGNISNDALAFPLTESGGVDFASYSSWSTKSLQVKSFYWNAGFQYTNDFKYGANKEKAIRLTVGLAGNPTFKVGDRSVIDEALYSVDTRNLASKTRFQSIGDYFGDLLVNNPDDVDTLKYNKGVSAPLKIPGYFQVGFTLADSTHWTVGMDFRYQPWSQYQGFENNSSSVLYNSWRVGLGGEYLHKTTSNANFFAKLKYRAGVYYKRNNIQVASTPIDEFGINVGFGIPIRRKLYDEYGSRTVLIHSFHLGVEAGSRGTQTNNLIKENFFRLRLGINFNDNWFVKRKYY